MMIVITNVTMVRSIYSMSSSAVSASGCGRGDAYSYSGSRRGATENLGFNADVTTLVILGYTWKSDVNRTHVLLFVVVQLLLIVIYFTNPS